jgi:hypothetical protein
MKFVRRTAGYSKWGQERNEAILDKLKIKPVMDCIQNYQRKGKEHMRRMNTGRMTKQILCYNRINLTSNTEMRRKFIPQQATWQPLTETGHPCTTLVL